MDFSDHDISRACQQYQLQFLNDCCRIRSASTDSSHPGLNLLCHPDIQRWRQRSWNILHSLTPQDPSLVLAAALLDEPHSGAMGRIVSRYSTGTSDDMYQHALRLHPSFKNWLLLAIGIVTPAMKTFFQSAWNLREHVLGVAQYDPDLQEGLQQHAEKYSHPLLWWIWESATCDDPAAVLLQLFISFDPIIASIHTGFHHRPPDNEHLLLLLVIKERYAPRNLASSRWCLRTDAYFLKSIMEPRMHATAQSMGDEALSDPSKLDRSSDWALCDRWLSLYSESHHHACINPEWKDRCGHFAQELEYCRNYFAAHAVRTALRELRHLPSAKYDTVYFWLRNQEEPGVPVSAVHLEAAGIATHSQLRFGVATQAVLEKEPGVPVSEKHLDTGGVPAYQSHSEGVILEQPGQVKGMTQDPPEKEEAVLNQSTPAIDSSCWTSRWLAAICLA